MLPALQTGHTVCSGTDTGLMAICKGFPGHDFKQNILNFIFWAYVFYVCVYMWRQRLMPGAFLSSTPLCSDTGCLVEPGAYGLVSHGPEHGCWGSRVRASCSTVTVYPLGQLSGSHVVQASLQLTGG